MAWRDEATGTTIANVNKIGRDDKYLNAVIVSMLMIYHNRFRRKEIMQIYHYCTPGVADNVTIFRKGASPAAHL